ncbi:ABC transporter family substrate-binding protein [Streptomyces sp. NBC_01619]|uniref:ABC transporter substrate-binding protein n=1 Tax=Streptomyces pratisoli TaxID=3139917 RepID=A0ACC6QML0_9ACTN|nr:ABC transporter substrate-binding protein [Streptomyces sp. NBC_01619]MCX4513037.1 ABC transporter family substrate-binding protein [Streptomyces sp. NBC_01619]
MSNVDAPSGRTCSRTPCFRTTRLRTSVALLTSGVLVLPVLAGCTSEETGTEAVVVPMDIGHAARNKIEQGGTLRWAVDAVPATLNTFQADADVATSRIAGAVLPSLFRLDERGRPQHNPDYLESAEIVDREPRQVVLYKLNQEAVWTDGREIGAADFLAQWRALSGKDSAYWTARNAGYDRIEKIERGKSDLEVRVTFAKPYADWRSLFTPLYPKETMGSPAAFNDGARSELAQTAGPFTLQSVDREEDTATLVRNPRWWGEPAKLDSLVLRAVPRDRRAAALATGAVDLAEIDRSVADRIAVASRETGNQNGDSGPGTALEDSGEEQEQEQAEEQGEEQAQAQDEDELLAGERNDAGFARFASEQTALRGFVVRKSLEPAYTQLALNGESGPLADERVRRAVARALDREELAEAVLKPLGLPAEPVGSHLALAGQPAYVDSSGALGDQDTQEAQALLADAGWTREGATAKQPGTKAGPEKSAAAGSPGAQSPSAGGPAASSPAAAGPAVKSPAPGGPAVKSPAPGGPAVGNGPRAGAPAHGAAGEGRSIAGDDKPGRDGLAGGEGDKAMPKAQKREGGVAGAYAPVGTRAPLAPKAPAGSKAPVAGPLGKDGKALTLRFVLPSGPGSEPLRTVGDRIRRMLDKIGIRTEITKVAEDSFFKDHIASGHYDLALYSWPASAYPATDARPIYAKPEPATDGSLLVEQNYTRVGTDRIDQLFDQALSELDEGAARELMKQADARIWAAAASIPLYQRPELVAAKRELVNAGAFGFSTPRYQDIGFVKAKAPAHGAGTNERD